MKAKEVFRTIKSRYGVDRTIISHGAGWYTMEGQSHYIRVGSSTDGKEMTMFDPEGGPFLAIGDAFEELGTISTLIQEPSSNKNNFKLRFEVVQDEPNR